MLFEEELPFLADTLAIILILLVLLVIQRHSNDQDAVERKHKEAQFQKQQDEEIALKEN